MKNKGLVLPKNEGNESVGLENIVGGNAIDISLAQGLEKKEAFLQTYNDLIKTQRASFLEPSGNNGSITIYSLNGSTFITIRDSDQNIAGITKFFAGIPIWSTYCYVAD
ncbi:MAG: hypothetical protein FWB72_07020 [Firmicutes bacterium]|nr:hypothetical protein [Bacillota bacterium]